MNNVNGFILIDAPASALNNAGPDIGAKTENTIAVKKIRRGRGEYVYVSGQAFRYWIRNSLENIFRWELSPIERESKIAFTAANPFKYPDDDVFGYMKAIGKKSGTTLTRVSPFKCSPLISVTPVNIVNDFGVMARHEGDPVPYEHQFYSTVLKGIFSLDLDSVGRFSSVNKTGYMNITQAYKEEWETHNCIVEEDGKVISLPVDIRGKRASELIGVLPYIFGGAKQTSHLTDVSPKFIVLAILNCGNNIFMNIAVDEKGEAAINVKALKEVILDYQENIISDLYIGKREGFMDEYNEDLKHMLDELNSTLSNIKVHLLTVNDAVSNFQQVVSGFYKR
ncbi:type I-B CRISPR-associated protein Cas7/Cst2/DevR [Aceticella autotrophica]|uniref:Type I-B CRISPR-associated protein Cas7/Cst2/DevR n=1 Tax=Aceticella autotrophica TaxID=2755338 RepID=A0A975GAV4_9THEO|nr:type I-B CRISPR-associated protein Cas7/Cst2/DevR [Aceticella autotrophica]QSZ27492.1 type I-B CRISPR-associated protein Cas7/Cst2/DevR [Aceticella autotrophica]